MNYTECENQISAIGKFSIKHGIDETAEIMKEICPGIDSIPVIHVAGTNGKGSVSSYIKYILMEAGYNVGMFISPHLVSMRERIEINGKMISKKDFVKAYTKVSAYVTQEDSPSFFEYLFLMAMCYFGERKPDYIILETGMGGRKDATNAVSNKALTVITRIGKDHTKYLGDTIAQIAGEKAGIIRKSVPLVYADYRTEASDVIKETYIALNEGDTAGMTGVSNGDISEIEYKRLNKGNQNGISFNLSCKDVELKNIFLNTTALYQCENASLAIIGAMALADEKINENVIRCTITQEEMRLYHSEMPHGGFVIRNGCTGFEKEKKHTCNIEKYEYTNF